MNYKSKQQMIKTIGITAAVLGGVIASINQFVSVRENPSIYLSAPGIVGGRLPFVK